MDADDLLYYEDVSVGDTFDLGSHTVTAEEIIEFAEKWDPLLFHLDAEEAAQTFHGELIASGYHTLCLANRHVVRAFRQEAAAVVGIGIENLRWHAPLRPGDTVAFELEVLEKRPSESIPDAGVVRERTTGTVDGDPVITYEAPGFFGRRGGPTGKPDTEA